LDRAVRRSFITWLTNSLIVFAGAVAISLGIGFVPIGVPSEQ
jgi:hypothetical protein